MPLLQPGTLLSEGAFEILALIGRGAYGEVYRARQATLDRDVAIKVLAPQVMDDPQARRRFEREARAAGSLIHPNILPMFNFQFDEATALWFLTMPYIKDGHTLRDELRQPISVDDALNYAGSIAGALDEAHARGIIHRDVKPANVLMDEKNRPLLADFGLAQLVQQSGPTQSGQKVGTPLYMSPEEATGGPIDPKSDQYSLAVMTYEMLAGRPPFLGAPESVIYQHINLDPPRLATLKPEQAFAAEAVLFRALSKSPDQRFSTCSAFADALAAAFGRNEEGVSAVPRSHPGPSEILNVGTERPADVHRLSRWRRRVASPLSSVLPLSPQPTLRLAAGGVLALVVVAATIFGGIRFRSASAQLQPMTGLFNVVVTDFGQMDEDGSISSSSFGARLSDSVLGQIREELQQTPALSALTEVKRHPEPVRGNSAEQRAQEARSLSDRLNAQVVVHGALSARRDKTEFVPEFYVAALPGVEELIGPNRLGAPITVAGGPGTLGQALVISDAMKARIEGLALFTAGLTYLAVQRPDNAVDFFERAAGVRGWSDNDGKEVAYLFLGSAYRARGQPQDIERAIEAYTYAARLKPAYARAFVSLGDIYYEETLRQVAPDAPQMELAISAFESAKVADIRPGSPDIEAKIRINLGNLLALKAQMGHPDAFGSAEKEFREVVESYERGNAEFRPFLGYAYLGIGLILERRDLDIVASAQYYRRAIEAAGESSDTATLARNQLEGLASR